MRYFRSHVKVIMVVVIVLFVLSCFAGYGLYSRSSSGPDGGKDYAVAEVDGRKVMRSDIEKGTMRLAEQVASGREITSDDIPMMRKAILDGTAIESQLEKEIKSRKISVTDPEIDEAYNEIMDSYPTREEFMSHIERSGVTENELRSDLKKQISQRKIIDSLADEIEVLEDEALEFYESAKSFLYKQPAGIKANLATFKTSDAAQKARDSLEAGESWDEVIERHKADIMTSTPYDKPVLLTEQMMADALAPLKEMPYNKVSPVLPVTENDSYIAIKRSKEAERQLLYSEVSADVTEMIKNQKVQQKQQEFYETLLSRAEIKILDPEIFPVPPAEDPVSDDQK